MKSILDVLSVYVFHEHISKTYRCFLQKKERLVNIVCNVKKDMVLSDGPS